MFFTFPHPISPVPDERYRPSPDAEEEQELLNESKSSNVSVESTELKQSHEQEQSHGLEQSHGQEQSHGLEQSNELKTGPSETDVVSSSAPVELLESLNINKNISSSHRRKKGRGGDGNMAARARVVRPPKNPMAPSFRATCYRTGERHAFQSPQV